MEEKGPKAKLITNQDVVALANKCNQMEKAFAQQLVYNPGQTDKDSLRRAGSKAKDKNLSKMAYEIKTRPHVQAYIQALTEIRSEDAAIDLQEIISYARECIDMAMANGKPKDAEGHLRLLAELGGHIKQGPSTVVENNLQTAQSFKGDKLEDDFKRFESLLN